MLALLVALFIVVPLVELYVIIQVGQSIGALPTIAVLVVDSVLGSLLLRSQGREAWRRFNETMAAGRAPAREVLDGGLIIFGGALLLTPGFITDVLGLLLLVSPSRAVVRRMLVGLFSRNLVVLGVSTAARRRRARSRQPYDVDGTVVDADHPSLER
jgi:UPF0716 protein FxsA